MEDPDNKGKLCDFISFTYFQQKCNTMEELGHNHELEIDATLWFYSFTKNTYEDMMKEALYLVRDDLKCDAFCIYNIQDH